MEPTEHRKCRLPIDEADSSGQSNHDKKLAVRNSPQRPPAASPLSRSNPGLLGPLEAADVRFVQVEFLSCSGLA